MDDKVLTRSCHDTQVKQLLSQDGAVIKENCFWMNSIKTHCYVIFETAEQAESIRCALATMTGVVDMTAGNCRKWLLHWPTHAYNSRIRAVVFSCENRQATFNVQFPRDSQKRLAPKFVTVEEAEGVILGTVSGTPRTAAAPAAAATPAAASEPTESPGVRRVRRFDMFDSHAGA